MTHFSQPEASASIVVFCGMSISAAEAGALLPHASIRPPISRGELYKAREDGAQTLVVIDGIFNQRLAISPREVVDVARDGATVFGASSMGALRAAECWPAGVRGVGTIFRLYRAGLLDSDDEVAVATVAELDFRPISIPLINVRFAVACARREGLLSREQARQIVTAARGLHFVHRRWKTIFAAAGMDVFGHEGLAKADLKHQDARLCLAHVAVSEPSAAPVPRLAPFAAPVRYPSHDRQLGRSKSELKRILVRWMFGSGRYQKYVWPVYLAYTGTTAPKADPATLRDDLAATLQRLLADETNAGELLWNEAEFAEDLHAELMRWHAHDVWSAETAILPPRDAVARVRAEIAIAHGYRGWSSLTSDVEDGKIFGAIPLLWVEEAVSIISRARSNRAAPQQVAA